MAISLFETRKMLKMVETRRQAETFLRDTFFGNVQNFDTKYIEYDVVDNKRDMASFADPNLGGVAVQRDGYSTVSFQAPELNPLMVTTAEDLMLRAPGENIYSAKSPMDRAAEQLGRDLAKLDDIIARREEWMCAQALMNGGIPIVGEGVSESVKFWTTSRINSGTPSSDDPYMDVSASAAWDGNSADVIGDLQTAQRKIRQNSGINPTLCIMGAEVFEAFAKNDKVQKILDNKRMNFGEVEYSQPLPNGVSYQGKFMGLDIMTYDSYFLSGGSESPIFPEKEILIGSPAVDTFMGYGACAIYDEGKDHPQIIAAPRVPSSWTQRQNPAGRIVQIKSRPLPVIQQKHGFFVIKAIAG